MTDNIINLIFPTFTNVQKFFVNLFYGNYKNKTKPNSKEIMLLLDQKLILDKEIKKLKNDIWVLRHENEGLLTRLRSANNMIRILSKTKEDDDENCKTPERFNILEVDRLLKTKLTKKPKYKDMIVYNSQNKVEKITSDSINTDNKFKEVMKKDKDVKIPKMENQNCLEQSKEKKQLIIPNSTNEDKKKSSVLPLKKSELNKSIKTNKYHNCHREKNKENRSITLNSTNKRNSDICKSKLPENSVLKKKQITEKCMKKFVPSTDPYFRIKRNTQCESYIIY